MKIEFIKTNSTNADFISLINLLDDDLSSRYGELQKQYHQHNKIDYIQDAIVVYKDDVPVACGAFKEHSHDTIELKRIFVKLDYRRQGLSKLLLNELENTARAKEYHYALLETGVKQIEAISLYQKSGYSIIANFEPYIGNTNSICMSKKL